MPLTTHSYHHCPDCDEILRRDLRWSDDMLLLKIHCPNCGWSNELFSEDDKNEQENNNRG